MTSCEVNNGVKSPFMALVDAAASILDENAKVANSDIVTDVRSSSSCDNSSRPSTPSVAKDILPHAVSPTSVSSGARSIEDSLSEKKLSFADQLMAILDEDQYCDVLRWMPDGKAFTIVDPKRFTKEFMPKFFNIRNMSSFVRKLTRWGFARVHEKETLNSDIFKHSDFQQGKPCMCREIRCVGRLSSFGLGASLVRSEVAAIKTPQAPKSVAQAPQAPVLVSSASLPAPNDAPSALPYTAVQRNTDPLLEALALRHYLEQQAMLPHSSFQHPSPWLRARPENYFTLHNRGALAVWAGHHNPSVLPY